MAIADERSAPNFLWGADMLQDVREPLFIDLVHYSDVLNRRLAKSIAVRFEVLGWPQEQTVAN